MCCGQVDEALIIGIAAGRGIGMVVGVVERLVVGVVAGIAALGMGSPPPPGVVLTGMSFSTPERRWCFHRQKAVGPTEPYQALTLAGSLNTAAASARRHVRLILL